MYAVCVRDHVMIAHSFKGELFGPARALHGATYVVDVEFRCKVLDPNGVVVDIGRASQVVRDVLGELNFRNLDEVPALAGVNTTTEYLAGFIFDRVLERSTRGELGSGGDGLSGMKVTLHESHVAWASYERSFGLA